jgi:hypothetical protein
VETRFPTCHITIWSYQNALEEYERHWPACWLFCTFMFSNKLILTVDFSFFLPIFQRITILVDMEVSSSNDNQRLFSVWHCWISFPPDHRYNNISEKYPTPWNIKGSMYQITWLHKYQTRHRVKIQCFKLSSPNKIKPYPVSYTFMENLCQRRFPGCIFQVKPYTEDLQQP